MSGMDKLARMIGGTTAATSRMNTGPQQQASTVIDGSLDFVSLVDTGEVDEDGDPILEERVTASLGVQEDGAVTLVTLDGPEPPIPAGVTAVGGIASIAVTWDGTWVDDGAPNFDHDHVAIHVAEKALVDAGTAVMPSNSTVAATIRPVEGGTVVVPGVPHTDYYVCAVSVTTAAKWSDPSELVEATPTSVLDDTELAARLANRPRFYTADLPPADPITEASWWLKADSTVWKYISGAWVQQEFSVTQSVGAGTVIAGILAAATATVEDISADTATIQTLYTNAFTAATAVVGNLEADQVKAGAIDGMVITGPTIRTAASGQRVQLDTTGLHGFDSIGTEKTTIGTDGKLTAEDVSISGTFHQESADNSRSVIIDDEIRLYGRDSGTGATIRMGYSGVYTPESPPPVTDYELQINAGKSIKVTAGGPMEMSVYDYMKLIAPTFTAIASTAVDIGYDPLGIGLFVGRILANATNTFIEHDNLSDARALVVTNDTGADLRCVNSGGTTVSRVLADHNGNLYLLGTPRMQPVSTTSSANTYFGPSSGGYRALAVSSSLRKLKHRIRNATVTADQARALRPRQWFDKGEMKAAGLKSTATVDECLAAGLRWIPGFVAEEVEAVSPLLCTYNEEGALTGVAYDRLAVALCARAEEAEDRLSRIEARLDAIEKAH